jgi:DNA invertase Pin-like site-specific DNA recombinase
MIEAGRADQLVVAYFDRLVRSLKVQLEVIERVERAGGANAPHQ